MSKRVWHYTVAKYLPSIIADGEIKLATAYVWEGRPVVWLSTNPRWEETANKSWESNGMIRFLSRDETGEAGQGLARIEVRPEAAPNTWSDFVRLSDTPKEIIKGLEKRALKVGSSPSAWRVSFTPVRREDWLAIEVWGHEQWISIEALQVAASKLNITGAAQ